MHAYTHTHISIINMWMDLHWLLRRIFYMLDTVWLQIHWMFQCVTCSWLIKAFSVRNRVSYSTKSTRSFNHRNIQLWRLLYTQRLTWHLQYYTGIETSWYEAYMSKFSILNFKFLILLHWWILWYLQIPNMNVYLCTKRLYAWMCWYNFSVLFLRPFWQIWLDL